MADALSHRGPDGRGIEVSGSVGLAHTRLAIVDPSPAGRQPMEDPSGRWLISFNGEIFNHRELRAQLPPAAYRGHSDTESLVHALGAWDDAAIARCNGMFAFAALDRAKRRLLLVRDRFGKKPLYFARHDGALWFASELRALLAAGIPRRARTDLLAHTAGHGWLFGRETPIDGAQRVLPGTVVSVDLDTLEATERRWYDPADVVDPELADELAAMSRAQLARRVEDSLTSAIERRLMSDVPIGTMCSGGLDSSLITAIASRARPGLVAFTAALSDQPAADEAPWAELVARKLGVELRTVDITSEAWRESLIGAVDHYEYPLPHESSVGIAAISRLACASGVKVLLTGEGADELFGGYWFMHPELYREFLPWRGRLARRIDNLRRAGLRGYLAWRLQRPPAPPPFPLAGASVEFAHGAFARGAAAYGRHSGPRAQLEAALLGALSGGVLPLLLNRMDKNAMQASVETRVPFLDPELVTLVLNLPLEHRVGPDPKGILRDVAGSYLPRQVTRRPKQVSLGADSAHGLLSRARPDFIEEGSLRETLGFPRASWRSLLAERARSVPLWTAEVWCRLFLEGQRPAAVESALWGANG